MIMFRIFPPTPKHDVLVNNQSGGFAYGYIAANFDSGNIGQACNHWIEAKTALKGFVPVAELKHAMQDIEEVCNAPDTDNSVPDTGVASGSR